jgi:DNA modification methylase
MILEKHSPAYLTNWGAAYCGDSLDLLAALPDASVNLVLTSPPFALQREKEYGNKA